MRMNRHKSTHSNAHASMHSKARNANTVQAMNLQLYSLSMFVFALSVPCLDNRCRATISMGQYLL